MTLRTRPDAPLVETRSALRVGDVDELLRIIDRCANLSRAYVTAVLCSNALAASPHTGDQMITAAGAEARAREALEGLLEEVRDAR
jgi:hypothetical protein